MTNTEHAKLLRDLANHTHDLANTLADDGFSVEAESAYTFAARARAAAAEIEGREVEYRFNVFVDDDWRAGGSAPTKEEAEREARHYLSEYEPEGDCITVIECCAVLARFGGGEVNNG